MNNSIFLAQALGIFLFVVSLWVLMRFQKFEVVANGFMDSPAMIVLTGLFTLTLGILIILLHNTWHLNWTVVITIIGWFVFIQGLIRLFLFDKLRKPVSWVLNHRTVIICVGVFWLLVGIFLLYHGFYVIS